MCVCYYVKFYDKDKWINKIKTLVNLRAQKGRELPLSIYNNADPFK